MKPLYYGLHRESIIDFRNAYIKNNHIFMKIRENLSHKVSKKTDPYSNSMRNFVADEIKASSVKNTKGI